MKVLLSWSMPRSKAVAHAFRDWLEMVVQGTELFFSPDDIEKGSIWLIDLLRELETTDVGIVFVTPENLNRPWLSFEAGAIAKHVGQSRVMPFLFGMEKDGIPASHPLFAFQSTTYDQQEVKQLVSSIARAATSPLMKRDVSDRLVDLLWSNLDERLQRINEDPKLQPTEDAATPDQASMIAEIWQLLRSSQRSAARLVADATVIKANEEASLRRSQGNISVSRAVQVPVSAAIGRAFAAFPATTDHTVHVYDSLETINHAFESGDMPPRLQEWYASVGFGLFESETKKVSNIRLRPSGDGYDVTFDTE